MYNRKSQEKATSHIWIDS